MDQDYFPFTRAFDNCFEMGDGDAVVFALMTKAKAEPDSMMQSLLTDGIRRAFSRNLDLEGWPMLWVQIYKDGQRQGELF